MKVSYSELALTQQVLERQQKHSEKLNEYIGDNCDLVGDLGVLSFLVVPAGASVVFGRGSAMTLSALAASRARAAGATLDAYVEADRKAYEKTAKHNRELGVVDKPFADPRDHLPELTRSATRADEGYGDAAKTPIGQVTGLAEDAGSTIGSTLDLVTDHSARNASVVEHSDAGSFLVPPQLGGNFVQDLRWKAGPLFGSVDWVCEKITGVSVIEDCIMKPFSGDWEKIGGAAVAWEHAGRSLREMAGNYSALPLQIKQWEGRGAETFEASMELIAASLVRLSYGFDFVGEIVSTVEDVSKDIATLIGEILEKLSDKLIQIAADAATPVIGWVHGAFTSYSTAKSIIKWINQIFDFIDDVVEAGQKFVDGKERLIEAVGVFRDVVSNYTGERTPANASW